MRKKLFVPAVITILTGVCLSLGWHHHQIRPISVFNTLVPAFDSNEETLQVTAKTLNFKECKQLLGYDLISQGIQPIQFTIQNNSPNEYSLGPNSIDLNAIDSKKVAHTIRNLTLPRGIGFKIAGFLFWPLMIPGTVDTVRSLHSYQVLKKDYHAKAMKEEIIPAYSVFHRILFVPQMELKQNFTMTFVETTKHKQLVFDFFAEEEDLPHV
jgi:hypothetical protein